MAVSKSTKNVLTATNPNDFIFHSLYNTFKIILVGTKEITLLATTSDQDFTQAHSLSFTPLVAAFAKESGYSIVFLPNSDNIYMWGAKTGPWTTGVSFNYITSDATNITFNFDNSTSQRTVYVRYFCLEQI